jgi:Ca-activated chloride channel family protein
VLEFAYAIVFLALPLPLLVLWLMPPQRERVSALRVPFFAQITEVAGSEARAGAIIMRRRRFQMLVAVLVWLLLIAGLAKPEWVGEPVIRTEAARDIMLALDLSGSMDYRDFPGEDGKDVSRFEAVQRVVDRFVAERESDRIGLIVFGTKAYVQLPFTRDLDTARALVELMEVGMAGPKTAVGDSIGLAIHSFENSEVEDRLLILLTDGNDTASSMKPISAADIAKLNGVEIYTIGIGDTAATGEDRVDFDILAEVAQRTGGEFYNAEDESALVSVYRRIDEKAVADVRTQSWRPRESLLHWPAGLAVALLIMTYTGMLYASRRRGNVE